MSFFKKRAAVAVSLVAAASLALSGCASDAGPGSQGPTESVAAGIPAYDGQDTTITFETYNITQGGAWAQTVNDLIAAFNKDYPNIHVNAQGIASTGASTISYAASLQAEILAGNAPDVAQETFDALDWMVVNGVVDPLEDVVGSQALEDGFGGDYPYNKNARTLADVDGTTYGVPYVFSTPVLWYNKTVLDKLGVTIPEQMTWDDMETIGKQLVAAGYEYPLDMASSGISTANWGFSGYVKANGGDLVSDDYKTLYFDKPETVAAVQRLRDLADEKILAPGSLADVATLTGNFLKGQTLMEVNTSNASKTIIDGAAAAGWELGTAKVPTFDPAKPLVSNSGSALFLVHQQKPDPIKQAASYELIKFLTSPTAVDIITRGIGYVPLRDTMASDPDGPLNDWYESQPGAKVNVAQLQNLTPWEAFPGNNYAQISTILATAVANAVFYGKDVQQTMSDAQKEAQALVR